MMLRKYLILWLFFITGPAWAADGLGRLFLTPEQRAQLETVRAQRDRRLPVIVETEVAPTLAPAAPTGPDVVTYSGMVRRSDGKSTVWINGKPLTERSKGDGDIDILGVRRDGEVAVAIPQAERKASLRVGQSLEVTSGTIEESYARRATLVRGQVAAPTATAAPPKEKAPAPPAPTAAQAAAKAVELLQQSGGKPTNPESGGAPAVRAPGK